MLARLKDQLQREVRQHPRKAAVLGVLALVAVWRIAPLVAGSFVSSSAAAASRAAAPTVGVAGAPKADGSDIESPETIESGKRVERLINWKLAGAALQSQPLLQSADRSEFRLDPFRIDVDQFSPPIAFVPPGEDAELWASDDVPAVASAEAAAAAPEPAPADVPPAREPRRDVVRAASEHPVLSTIQVTAVLVTGQRSLAVIGGRVHRTGDALRLPDAAPAMTQTFRVIRIGTEGVIVQSDGGERYLMPLAGRSRGIDIAPTEASAGVSSEPPRPPAATTPQRAPNAAAEPTVSSEDTRSTPSHVPTPATAGPL